MDDSDSATPLTLDDLIAFGRYYLEALKDRPVGDRIMLTPAVLQQFLETAIEALVRQRDQAPKRGRKGGRPPGGMGDMMKRLMDSGVPELNALHIVVRAWGKDAIAVLLAYQRACENKKPPRRRKRATKNPT